MLHIRFHLSNFVAIEAAGGRDNHSVAELITNYLRNTKYLEMNLSEKFIVSDLTYQLLCPMWNTGSSPRLQQAATGLYTELP